MPEADTGAERPRLSDEFRQILDGHFHTVGGRGTPVAERAGEESIGLLSDEALGLETFEPYIIMGIRPEPGLEELTAAFWPDLHGHRIEMWTDATPNSKLQTILFVRNERLMYLSVLVGLSGMALEAGRTIEITIPEIRDHVLHWTRGLTPALPDD